MSTPILSDREFFTQNLPDFTEEYPYSRHVISVLFNHIHVAYFLDDVEVHSAKFYTACLSEPDIVNQFLVQLEEDVDTALNAQTMREFFASTKPLFPEEPAEPEYVWNSQPILDAAPTIPGLVKFYDVTYRPNDEDTIVQYKLSDGMPVAEFKFSPSRVVKIYEGSYDASMDDEHESFTETMLAALDDLESKGFIIRKDLAA